MLLFNRISPLLKLQNRLIRNSKSSSQNLSKTIVLSRRFMTQIKTVKELNVSICYIINISELRLLESSFIDPASKYLEPGTPVSDLSGKDLPSPTGIKGEKNMLLLPYY